MRILHRIKSFLQYQCLAQTKYYIHSPFVYQFYLYVLERKQDFLLDKISSARSALRCNTDIIFQTDLGTGKSSERKVSVLESKVAVKEKYGEVLFRLAGYFKPETIIELGTSIGISSAYLALGNSSSKVVTLEGSSELVDKAKSFHCSLGTNNVEYLEGNIDAVLPNLLSSLPQVDLVFVDGNHSKEATLRYFKMLLPKTDRNSIIVFDDIYWSGEMTDAWNEIKTYPSVKLTLDIYQFGIVFFRTENVERENFRLRY